MAGLKNFLFLFGVVALANCSQLIKSKDYTGDGDDNSNRRECRFRI